MSLPGLCADCNGFTCRPDWYRHNRRYQRDVDRSIRRHRRVCLKIPRVYKSESGVWWVIEYANGGRMWTGSWGRAVEAAVKGVSWPP